MRELSELELDQVEGGCTESQPDYAEGPIFIPLGGDVFP